QHIAAYDAERKKVVMVGYDGTYLWDGATWTKAAPQNPIPRSGRGGLAYDPIRKEVVEFGGENTAHTFVWNGSDWSERNPATVPPAVSSTRIVYDAGHQRMIIFGGQVPN